MNSKKRFLVTSALPYANGPLHIGHLAGAYLPADIYVRFLRLMDKDVVYIGGSDEHGAAITTRALKENISPQDIVDKYHVLLRDTFQSLGISFDYYDRTSASHHHALSQEFFRDLYHNGSFIEKTTEQYYDEEAQQFLADRYIKGTCPNCDYDSAYGDQCENCGTTLSPIELINPSSTITGSKPVIKETRHWFLPLDQHEDWLRTYVEEGIIDGKEHHDPSSWKAHVIGQCKSWIDGGLQPRAITRDLNWGIDVPSEIPGSEGKKLYVWLDAPIGYISSTIKWAEENNKDWKPYWQDEDSAIVHFVGKDNIVFHCIIFQVILKEKGGYNLPVNVPANQFLNLEGKKISTSRNWAIWAHEWVADHPDWIEQLRFYMVKVMPETRDSEFTWKGFQEAVNNELVNNLANFVHRVCVLTHKYYDGVVPSFDPDEPIIAARDSEETSYHDAELLSLFDMIDAFCARIRNYDMRGALQQCMEISSMGNQLLQFNEPWKTIKTDPENVKVVLNLGMQYVGALSAVLFPFMPTASNRLRRQLYIEPLQEQGDLLQLLDQLSEGIPIIPEQHTIGPAKHLFTKIEDATIDKEIEKLHAAAVEQSQPEISVTAPSYKDDIDFGTFTQLDLRVGKIISAEPVPKTDKLLKLEVQLAHQEIRTVVSGIAQHYNAEELKDQQVTVVANLAPKKIRGVLSHGMILMAENEDGVLSFVQPDKAVLPGSTVS